MYVARERVIDTSIVAKFISKSYNVFALFTYV